jgi:hypothetical protein
LGISVHGHGNRSCAWSWHGIIDDPRACNFDTNTLVCADKVASNFAPVTPKHGPHVSTSFLGNYLFSPDYPQEQCYADGANLVCLKDDGHSAH